MHVLSPDATAWDPTDPAYAVRKARRRDELLALLRAHYPAWGTPTVVRTGTPATAEHFLGQASSYGLSVGGPRFRDYDVVRALRPETEVPGLYLTGVDILLPGVCSALASAVLTVRQVLGVSLWDSFRGRDVLDRVRARFSPRALGVKKGGWS